MTAEGLIRRVPGLVGGRPTLRGRRLTPYDVASASCNRATEAALREYLLEFELTLPELGAVVTY